MWNVAGGAIDESGKWNMCFLGVGINLNQLLFIGDAPNPVSVRQITGRTVVVAHAAEQVRECIMARYMTLAEGTNRKHARKTENCTRRSGF